MKLEELRFTSAEIAKLIGFLCIIGGMWYDLKTDFEVHKAELRLLDYRIEQLEKSNRMVSAFTFESCAIVPGKIELKDEQD